MRYFAFNADGRDARTTGKGNQVLIKVFLEGLEGGGGISAGIVRDMVGVIQGLSTSPLLRRHDGCLLSRYDRYDLGVRSALIE
jgi:hypothetical protein